MSAMTVKVVTALNFSGPPRRRPAAAADTAANAAPTSPARADRLTASNIDYPY